MMGRLLSVETMEANDPDFLVAQKIMDDNSKTTIFLGNLYKVSISTVILQKKYSNSICKRQFHKLYILYMTGNERMANGTWITQGSVPMTPTGIQPPIEASFMGYFTLKIDTIGGNKVIVPTYGSPNEKITAICEYGIWTTNILECFQPI